MSEGEAQTSGELSSFLHLTGWRPVLLALVAGLAGAVGMYMALQEPIEWVGRYVVNGQRIADDDFTPAELDLFVEEIVLSARLPQVINEVEEITGLVEEEDYEITTGQAPASVGLINVTVVSGSPEAVRTVAVETSLAAMDSTLTGQRSGLEAGRAELQLALDAADRRANELIEAAGGVSPEVAYDRAVALLFDRQDFLENRPMVTVTDPDGNQVTRPADEPESPTLEELEADVENLQPVFSEYQRMTAEINQLTLQVSSRNGSIREIDAAIASLATEREAPFVISEVEIEEASRISGLLTGVLLFAVPAALIMIVLLVLYDLIFGRPESTEPAQPLDSYGILEAGSARAALPEASITTLVVVDDEPEEDEPVVEEVAADSDEEADDDSPPRRKSNRWGRDAGSKAG